MTAGNRNRNVAGLRKHARAKAKKAEKAATAALDRLVTQGAPITVAAVAREAGVSSRYITTHPTIGPRVRALRGATKRIDASPEPQAGDTSIVAVLRARQREVEQRHREEVRGLREQITALQHQLETVYGELTRLQRGKSPP